MARIQEARDSHSRGFIPTSADSASDVPSEVGHVQGPVSSLQVDVHEAAAVTPADFELVPSASPHLPRPISVGDEQLREDLLHSASGVYSFTPSHAFATADLSSSASVPGAIPSGVAEAASTHTSTSHGDISLQAALSYGQDHPGSFPAVSCVPHAVHGIQAEPTSVPARISDPRLVSMATSLSAYAIPDSPTSERQPIPPPALDMATEQIRPSAPPAAVAVEDVEIPWQQHGGSRNSVINVHLRRQRQQNRKHRDVAKPGVLVVCFCIACAD